MIETTGYTDIMKYLGIAVFYHIQRVVTIVKRKIECLTGNTHRRQRTLATSYLSVLDRGQRVEEAVVDIL